MMRVPFLDIPGQDAELRSEILSQIARVCEGSRFVLGPDVEAFERAFATYCGVIHCVGLNSGTSALHLALRCLEIGPGDEVITVPMTFVATAWAIQYVGATPVFVDIDPVRRTMDPNLLRRAITSRTRAILPVHIYGQPADMAPILTIASQAGISVVEDASQAHGARYQCRHVGAWGHIGCFSFYPGKNLGAYGEAGALVTNDPQVADRARMLRNHAQRKIHEHECLGYNYRMDALQAVVLLAKLRMLESWNTQRRKHAEAYRAALADQEIVQLPSRFLDSESAGHLFVVELDHRDDLARSLLEAGIQTGLHYPVAVHRQKAFAYLKLNEGTLPHAERLARRCLSLPMFPHLRDEQIDYVCTTLKGILLREFE
jgi:dTDP-4-amino-4,6-dideoxygalactose transaminase